MAKNSGRHLAASRARAQTLLHRLVFIGDPQRQGRPLRGLGIAPAGVLRVRSSYWLRVRPFGMLRVRITAREAPRGGQCVYFFAVTSQLRAV
jgi:hypothetical protein